MTAHAMEGDRMRCLAAGMDGYVTKPIDPEQVEHAIPTALGNRADFGKDASLVPGQDV
jgi:two-component system sensor histidine kinase/response regulator